MKHIPNILTLFNLLAGCFAIVEVMNGNLGYASWFLILALVFDLLDGGVARLLGAASTLGKQLDSLADVVSFGVAPAFIMYTLLDRFSENDYLPYLAFLIPASAALRLARFNIDPGQEKEFHGLPAPAAALMFLSIPMALLSGANR